METYLGEADEQVIVIVADGGLNKGTAGQINDVVQRAIDCGMRGVIVDCARLDILSSAGLASLLMLHRRMKDHGGEVKIAGLQGMSVQVLRLAKLDSIFQLYPDVAQARLSFRPKQG
ncbi:MAG: Anti-anti-sigma-B factor [Planctomycetota bacterium]